MKKFFAVFSVVLILFLFTLPLFALDFIIHVNISLYADDPTGGNYTDKFVLNYSYSGNTYTTNYTHVGVNDYIDLVYTDLDFCRVKAVLTSSGEELYTGYKVSITVSDTNVIPMYFSGYTVLSDGSYYVANDTYLEVTTTVSGLPSMIWTPVNLETGNSYSYGYQSGYEQGRAAQYTEDLNTISDLQSQIDSLEAQLSSLTGVDIPSIREEEYNRGYQTGFADAPATKQFVTDVVTTGIDGFTDVIKQFFNLNVLGIYVYQIVLIACLIPLFIFILKITMAKHG